MQKLCEITSTLLNAKINGSLLLYKIEQAYNMLDLLGRKENKRKEGEKKKKKKKKKRGGGRHTKKNTENQKVRVPTLAHEGGGGTSMTCNRKASTVRQRQRQSGNVPMGGRSIRAVKVCGRKPVLGVHLERDHVLLF